MAVYALKMACALAMVNALIRLCHGGSDSENCQPRPCGTNNQGVEIMFPFAAAGDECRTDYPHLEFKCVDEVFYLNFTSNAAFSSDVYQVMKIDYRNQILSVIPNTSEAICRPFDAHRFDGLNITNTSTLLLNCPIQLHDGSCKSGALPNVQCPMSDDNPRWFCPMELNNFTDSGFSDCHLMNGPPPPEVKISGSGTLELQFKGNWRMITASKYPINFLKFFCVITFLSFAFIVVVLP